MAGNNSLASERNDLSIGLSIQRGLIHEGEGFVSKLDGIFAFALVDLESLTVLLGRDIFGVKPLYFFRAGSGSMSAARCGHCGSYPETDSIVPTSLDRTILMAPGICLTHSRAADVSIRASFYYLQAGGTYPTT